MILHAEKRASTKNFFFEKNRALFFVCKKITFKKNTHANLQKNFFARARLVYSLYFYLFFFSPP